MKIPGFPKSKPLNHNISPITNECLKLISEVTDIATLRKIAIALWSLLDDIDTASDMFKPDNLEGYKTFYNYVMRKAEERHKHMTSDGYELFV
jgi:hypothetical protein